MPSVSKKQARFMAAAAHNPKFAKKAGIKRSVAKEFNRADAGTGILRKAFGGVVARAAMAPYRRDRLPNSPMGGALRAAVAAANAKRPPAPPPSIASSKGTAFRGRNAGPVKPMVTTETDQTLNETGDALRNRITMMNNRTAALGRRGMKEGGKVGSAMSALQQLAKAYKEALNLDDTEKAARLKRQMERLKPGSTKDLDAEAEEVGKEKAATFAEGGRVSKLRDAMKAVRAHGYRLRKVDGEFQIRPDEKSWDDDTTYYTNDLDDAVSTAKAERAAMNRKAK